MNELDGVWMLVAGRAWDEQGRELPSPYGDHPVGTIVIGQGRMLAALCRGDSSLPAGVSRGYSSYGGPYTFDGRQLVTSVDIASEPARIGGKQVRDVVMDGERMVLRPPLRPYDGRVEQREIAWIRIWRPGATG